MEQYEKKKKYNYKFLGVFPIDFATKINNHCLYSDVCSINLNNIKKNIKFVGLITNLDKHNEPGSHWTSLFMVIDPKLITYGAYYYDSTGSPIPENLNIFIESIAKQCNDKYMKKYNKEFKIIYNKKKHQYKGTECGVFSMVFQIRFLNKNIVKNNNTSFDEIIKGNPNINDNTMVKLRDELFRPNTKSELEKYTIMI